MLKEIKLVHLTYNYYFVDDDENGEIHIYEVDSWEYIRHIDTCKKEVLVIIAPLVAQLAEAHKNMQEVIEETTGRKE